MSHRRSKQSRYALVSALILAFLYFALMELMLIEPTRALREAQRFRSRIIAGTLAENGAELAAVQIVNRLNFDDTFSDFQGKAHGTLLRKVPGGVFEIEADGTSSGVDPMQAKVRIEGIANESGYDTKVEVRYTFHSQ